jgi:hypothetical protein
MPIDFNDAGPQQNLDVIPDGTVATVLMKIRPGGAGEGGYLRRSKDGLSEALDCEFTVTDEGPYRGRKFWGLFTVRGERTPDKDYEKAVEISRRRFRAMLDSVHGLKPDDESEPAKQARRLSSWDDFDGISFIAKIGVEPPQNGYKAKNKLDRVITPDEKVWHSVPQSPKPPSSPAAPAAKPASTPVAIARPQWANRNNP